MSERPDPTEDVRRLYEDAEKRTADAMEELVKRDAFGELLARATENILAVTRIGNDAADLVVRNLRLAGRRDITSLARQLARTEDKLEQVLQEVERLQEQLADVRARERRRTARPAGAPPSRPRASERRRATRPRAGRRGRVRQPPADPRRRQDRRHAEGRRVDAPQDDAVPLPLHEAARTRCRSCSCSRSSTGPTSSTCGPATRSSSSCSRRATTSSSSTGACPATRTPTWASTTTSCDELPWGMRETLRASGQEELSLLGWCIGGSLVAMHAALEPGGAGAQPRPAHHAGGHDGRDCTPTGWGATPSTPSSSPRCCRRCPAPASTGPTR